MEGNEEFNYENRGAPHERNNSIDFNYASKKERLGTNDLYWLFNIIKKLN